MRQKLFISLMAMTVAYGARAEFKANLKDWSLEDKVGQLLLVGFRRPEEIVDIKAGGVVLFAWNMKSVDSSKALTRRLKKLAADNLAAPLFIATDHEGGKVLRLRQGLTPFPDAAAVGALQNPQTAFEVGQAMGLELSALGINMNLAPVLDLGNARSFLENRIWSENPESVGRLTASFIQGLMKSGIFPVAKHFPGHGNSVHDSHFALPVIKKDLTRLWREDLEPFREVIQKDVPGIMTAHVELPAIDRGPASLSETFVTDILREKMNFKGLVMTDDLEMGGAVARDGTPAEELGLQALKAGTDVILVVWSRSTQKKMFERIVRAVQKRELSEEWLDAKVARILELKKKFIDFKAAATEETDEDWRKNLRREDSLRLAQNIRFDAIKWFAGKPDLILSHLGRVWKKSWAVAVPQGVARQEWRKARPGDRIFELQRRPDAQHLAQLQKFFKDSVQSGQALVVVSPPRASSSEDLFALLRRELSKTMQRKNASSPVLWVHQGLKPVQLRQNADGLNLGILSIYSSSTQSLGAFMAYLKQKTQSPVAIKR